MNKAPHPLLAPFRAQKHISLKDSNTKRGHFQGPRLEINNQRRNRKLGETMMPPVTTTIPMNQSKQISKLNALPLGCNLMFWAPSSKQMTLKEYFSGGFHGKIRPPFTKPRAGGKLGAWRQIPAPPTPGPGLKVTRKGGESHEFFRLGSPVDGCEIRFSHHFETMVETVTFVGIYRGIIRGGAGFRPSTISLTSDRVELAKQTSANCLSSEWFAG